MWIGKKCIELRYGSIRARNRIYFCDNISAESMILLQQTMMVSMCNYIQSLSCALHGAGPVRAERHPRQRKYCVKCQICFKISQMLRVLSRPLLKYIVHNSHILKRYKTEADWEKGCVKVFLSNCRVNPIQLKNVRYQFIRSAKKSWIISCNMIHDTLVTYCGQRRSWSESVDKTSPYKMINHTKTLQISLVIQLPRLWNFVEE